MQDTTRNVAERPRDHGTITCVSPFDQPLWRDTMLDLCVKTLDAEKRVRTAVGGATRNSVAYWSQETLKAPLLRPFGRTQAASNRDYNH